MLKIIYFYTFLTQYTLQNLVKTISSDTPEKLFWIYAQFFYLFILKTTYEEPCIYFQVFCLGRKLIIDFNWKNRKYLLVQKESK